MLLATSALATISPVASAHTCASYDGCDASNCPDGEEHNHTDFNRIERDEHCESHADPNSPPPEPCIIAGEQFPGSVCEFICNKLGGSDCDRYRRLPNLGNVR